MTPDQIMIVKAVSDILAQLGTLPLGTLIVVGTIGPWVSLFIVAWMLEKNQTKRFDDVVKMYEDNVILVKNYEELVKAYKSIVDNQQELIIHSTQTMTQVKDISIHNLSCPLVRDKKVEVSVK